MKVQPSTVNGMKMGVQEWRDALFLKYGLDPPDLPKFYNGCNATSSICHALDCNMVVIVRACHNKLCDRVAEMSGKAFTPTHVPNNPLILAGCAVKRTMAKPSTYKTTPSTNKLEVMEQKGDLLICDLCQNGTDSIQDMHDLNTRAKSH